MINHHKSMIFSDNGEISQINKNDIHAGSAIMAGLFYVGR